MRILVSALALMLAAGPAFAQCFKIAEVDAEKPDGLLLQQIGQEANEASKIALMEKFLAEYPKHDATGWVLEQAQALYIKANNPDKALAAGDKIYALSPDCAETNHQALKAAEAKKDPDLIAKWSGLTSQAAAKMAASPKPADEDEVDAWSKRVDWAKQVKTYTEYSLYATALQVTDPKKKIELIEALEQRNPSSEYLPKSYGQLFIAYRQAGVNDKALALAEKILATDQSDPDMLLVVASDYVAKKKEPAKVHAYSAKAAELAAAQPKPEGVADADWQKLRGVRLGAAHFLNGSLYYAESNWAQADKFLREALPYLDNPQLKAEALYYLGFANYKLEKAQEAANFYRQCGTIKSRFQALANKNLQGIKSQYSGVK
jgi:tetratricopeptide (TPR) repeat protein